MSASPTWVLCAGTIPAASFAERVTAAAEAGFDAITLFPEHYLDAIEREQLNPIEIRRCLEDAGVFVQQLDPLLDWYESDASKSELRLYEAAEATNARSINVAPAFAPTGDQQFLQDRLGAVALRAAQRGLSIDLEFLPWSPIPSLSAAVAITQACGTSNLGVMLDSWHFFRGGGLVRGLTPELLDQVTGVQLNDAPRVPPRRDLRAHWDTGRALLGWARNGWRTLGPRDFVRLNRASVTSAKPSIVGETLTRRLLPGEGEQPVSDLFSKLMEADCPAPMGVEVFNSALQRLPAREAAAQAMAACRRLTGIDPSIDSRG